ncbi:hypothetical protein FIBSPDRAFT_1053000 [Athelia psychrophila]|uniref:Cytochrome b561 domain-containing protein n=1 Tax=Athelia psychrophila TaxID=1759441 RepID=A0A167XMI3_9AGAM|nr:hypothetical protein FIBSPDRAFT_1053000 [Fibularhizoctonia sp. CBS 109695]
MPKSLQADESNGDAGTDLGDVATDTGKGMAARMLSVGSKPSFVYTVSSISTKPAQLVVWALASALPSGASPDAKLMQHIDSGICTLDLTLPSNSTTPTTTSAGDPAHKRYMKIINHGILCTVGILGPPRSAGSSRGGQTFTTYWFAGHAVVQAMLNGLIIVAGIALGVMPSMKARRRVWMMCTRSARLPAPFVPSGRLHHPFLQIQDRHPSARVELRARRPRAADHHPRPLASKDGYIHEYPEWTMDKVPRGVNRLWILWVVLIPVVDFAGLALVPRQFKQDGAAKAGKQQIEWREIEGRERGGGRASGS